jgi:hypothetical protein
LEPDDVLTDPGLKHQLELAWGLRNVDDTGNTDRGTDRLPETHVKTLPFEDEASCQVYMFLVISLKEALIGFKKAIVLH